MERTQPDPTHEDPPQSPLARYGRSSNSIDAQVDQMLRDMAARLEQRRPDAPLTSVGRIALIQVTTMAPPYARRLRALAPEITGLITRRAYAAKLRALVGPAEPTPPPQDLPEPTPWTEDRTATAAEILARARVDYAHGQAQRARADHEDRIHGHEPGGDH